MVTRFESKVRLHGSDETLWCVRLHLKRNGKRKVFSRLCLQIIINSLQLASGALTGRSGETVFMKQGMNSKGSALVMVVAMSVVAAIFAVTGLSFTQSNFSMSSSVVDEVKAFYFAEAGIQRALYKIKNEANPAITSWAWPFAGQTVVIDIATPTLLAPTVYPVTSRGTCRQSQKTITATIQKQGTSATLSAWGS